MLTDRISRRRVLAGAGATAVAGAMTLPALPAAADQGEGDGPLGSWLVMRTAVPPGPAVQTILTFAGGGAMIERDNNPPGAPGLGSWAPTDHHGFAFNFLSASGGGPPSNVSIVQVMGTGRSRNDNISGSFTVTVTDGSGNVLGSGTGTFQGSRISPTG